MQYQFVPPGKVILPGEDTIRRMPSVVVAYRTLLHQRDGSPIPSIVVIRSRKKHLRALFAKRVEEYPSRYRFFSGCSNAPSPDDFNKFYSQLDTLLGQTSFYLLDGTHRIIAAYLARVEIPALLLTSDMDLSKLTTQNTGRKIPPFPHAASTINELAEDFERYTFGTGLETLPPVVWTGKTRTEQLIDEQAFDKDLFPEYFLNTPQERYGP